MSEPIASTYVEIRPQLSPNFEGDLKRDIKQATQSGSVMSAQQLGIREVENAIKELQGLKVGASQGVITQIDRQIASLVPQLELAKKAISGTAAEQDRLAGATDRAAGASNRNLTSIRQLARSYGVAGIAVTAGIQAFRETADALRVTGAEAGTTEGRIRNLGASLLTGNVIGAFKALRTEFTLTTEAFQDLQSEIAKGDTSNAAKLAEFAQATGNKKLLGQLTAASAGVRANLQSDRAAQASITPGLQDDLAAAKTAEREAQIGLRVFKAGTAEYSKAFEGYAAAVAERRQVQQQIQSKSGAIAQDARRDAQFQLDLARKQQTASPNDDRALLQARRDSLRRQVASLEERGADTDAAKERLRSLYGHLADVEGQLTQITKAGLEAQRAKLEARIALEEIGVQIQAANARTPGQEIAAIQAQAALARQNANIKTLDAQARAGYELEAAQADKQIFEINKAAAEAAKQKAEEEKRIAEQERQAAEAKLKRQQDAAKQLRELRLENAVAKAGLTETSADDKKAVQAQIAYYKGIVANTTGLEREQARATLIAKRAALKGLKGAGGGSVGDFFKEALSDFRTFGSNFASSKAGGVLSPQQARGLFSANVLANASGKQLDTALAQERTRNSRTALAEQRRQTSLLTQIARSVGGGNPTHPGRKPKNPQGSMDAALLGAYIVHGV